MPKSKLKWQLIGEYPITEYQCGARAGDQVKLRRDLVIRDHKGMPTGELHREGEICAVVNGCAVPPLDVWLKWPDGERHTWSDNDGFWEWFERIGPP
jgi:hypothetical protein